MTTLGSVLKSNKLFLFILVAFTLILRIFNLNSFPIGITHDELNYIVAAKSLFLTHSFPPGTAPAILPTSMTNFTVVIAEIPAIILSGLIGFLPMSLFSARVIGAIFSSAVVLAVYFIALHITKKKMYAVTSSLIMAINPWSFLMGRTVFEVNFFVALFLWGFLVLINTKGWKMFYSLPFYLLGFLSYTGGQIGFFVFMIVSLIYRYFVYGKDTRNLTKYLVFSLLLIVVLVGYVLMVTNNQTLKGRSNELYLPTSPGVSNIVNEERKLTVPSRLNGLFLNKATVYLQGFNKKYLNTFSVDNLFLTGEFRAAFSYQKHGTFYLVDSLFIILGLSALFVVNKKAWKLFFGVIAGCALTAGFNVIEFSYSQRVGLIYPFLGILAGVGVGTVISAFKSGKGRRIVILSISVVYLASFINLMHIYYFRLPAYASDGWFFQDRILTKYLTEVESSAPDKEVFVYTSEPKIIFEEYLFYINGYRRDNAFLINQLLNQKDYSLGNITFSEKCPTVVPKDGLVIFDSSFGCKTFDTLTNVIRITRLRDVNANYLIYNDGLCKEFAIGSFVQQANYKDFRVEMESAKDFCLKWVTKNQ